MDNEVSAHLLDEVDVRAIALCEHLLSSFEDFLSLVLCAFVEAHSCVLEWIGF